MPPLDAKDLENRFSFHPATDDKVAKKHEAVRSECWSLARYLVEHTPPGRNQSLMVTALEEVMFRANAAIATGS